MSIASFFIGILFGFGLLLAGMLNPAKVQGFLDITGNWDPSLAFVMVGGIGVSFIGLRLIGQRTKPLLADMFHHPISQQIDSKLIGGSVMFGIGWGLGGLCPGPAIAVLGTHTSDAVIFVAMMLAGLYIGRRILSRA